MKTISILSFASIAIIVCESYGYIIESTIGNMESWSMLSGECRLALELYMDNMNNSTGDDMWALRMWDASSKFPVGLMSYNFGEMGNFDQCIETKSTSNNIMGKYCLGTITVNNTRGISSDGNIDQDQQIHSRKLISVVESAIEEMGYPTLAICIPSNCSGNDVSIIFKAAQSINTYFKYVVCQTKDDVYPQLTTDAIIGISVLSVIMATMVLSTWYDLYCRFKLKDPSQSAMIAFSVYTNSKDLFRIKKNTGDLAILHGLRFLSMLWILVGHTRYVFGIGPMFNGKDFTNFSVFMIFLTNNLAVETFLVIGGLLVSYVFFKQKRYKEFNIFKHYFHRYLRLTPPLAGLVLVSATLLEYMGSGPKWNYRTMISEGNCKKYWWATLLYFQNYNGINNLCTCHTWYLDVDMQLFLFTPLILFLLKKYPRTAVASLVLAACASISSSIWMAYDNRLPGIAPSFYSKVIGNYLEGFYIKTHYRAAPWLVGIILGFHLTKDGSKSLKIPKILSILAWTVSFVVMTLCIFSGHTILRNDDRLGNAFYLGLQKPAWSICLAWIIWACATNRGGMINTILSYPIFQFLNQFSYSMYLLHIILLDLVVFSQKMGFYYTLSNMIFCSCAIFLLTCGLSIIWVLTFEKPVYVLEERFLRKREH